MTIIQCKMCKKPFQYLSSKFCHNCLKKIDDDFIKVRDYIYDHSDVDIDIVAKETEVDKAVITHLLQEGRLVLANASGCETGLCCRVCRKPIKSGEMCEPCKNKLGSVMQKSIDTNKPPPQEGRPKETGKYDVSMHHVRYK